MNVIAAYLRTLGLEVVSMRGDSLLPSAAQKAPQVEEDPMSKEVANRNAKAIQGMFMQMQAVKS